MTEDRNGTLKGQWGGIHRNDCENMLKALKQKPAKESILTF